ncbi:right-handed parallel beta-helix repeat-containing protein [Planctomicrobium piriforme]|uniref:Right handed beta helix region n=1 Tax=Planctomicrobium piriforme TaxID=1576369 RepID=A0A1I3QHZ8_9PLAN|nr:right-handed parallel beta-helix repeat-containing protein [Planctomicrobium piriforme]SFJ32957.1 Right handed beta helix region [Planctomicrobium piriforme]
MNPLLRVFVLNCLVCSISSAADVQLSPNGPIRTPQAARDAARAAAKPARVIVGDGEYALTEPLVLGAEDSQVTWLAAPGAKPVFNAGQAITGWTRGEGGVWKAKVPEAKAGKWDFEQLWVNDRRATRARTPNKGFFNIAGAAGPKVFPGVEETKYRAFTIAPEHFEILEAIPASQRDGALMTVMHAWAVGQCRIEALDDATQSVLIKGKSAYRFVEIEPDQRYWVENFAAALDAPGEWFLDKQQGELLYRPLPGEDMTKAAVVAPVANQFVVMKNAREIRFQGLKFLHGNYLYPAEGLHDRQASTQIDGCVDIENGTGVHFENCEIGHAGRYGVYFRNGCSDCSLRHCHLHDLGGGGVRIGETQRPSEERLNHHIVVDDCIIQHAGRLHPSACGVTLTHAQHCEITHCDIGDLFYTGVSTGWNWGYGESLSRDNTVENNHIHHLGWAYLSDMGGFYNLGNAPGTAVRGNHVHHIASHRYGGWGLYTDEGSTDVLMENNLVHDTSNSGFHQHYGFHNHVRNNIFAFGQSSQVQRSRNESHLSFIFEHNIVVWDPASPLFDGGEANWKLNETADKGDPRDPAIFRSNLYWPTDGKTPQFLTKAHYTWDEWRKMGRDAGSLFADPKFEDLAKRDFRLKQDSPASKIGFKPWDLNVAGVRRDGPEGATWRQLAAQGHEYPTWDAEAQPWPAPDFKIELQTFESIPPGVIGLHNATYNKENKGESIGVSEEAASPIPVGKGTAASKRSLKIQDAPNLSQTFCPILDVPTNWDAGTMKASFDAMAQPGADWFFEMRTSGGGEYGAGPMVSWKNGVLSAGLGDKTKLAEIPPGEWIRVAVTATTGKGSFDVTVTRQNGAKKDFKKIPCKPEWNQAHYLLWSALGTTQTAFFLDNVSLTREAK